MKHILHVEARCSHVSITSGRNHDAAFSFVDDLFGYCIFLYWFFALKYAEGKSQFLGGFSITREYNMILYCPTKSFQSNNVIY